MLDFHNHLIPQVDDGSESIEASAGAIAIMRDQGIKNIITTPHLRASLLQTNEYSGYFAAVDAGWKQLSDYASKHFPDVRLERGFEILLDVRNPDLTDPRTRLAGTQFILVEFPFTSVPPNSPQALFDIRMQGYEPIVAHPERYLDAQLSPRLIEQWIGIGVPLQLNAGSLLGVYGPQAKKTSWQILANGWASYVSSDYHARGTCHTAAAVKAIKSRGSDEVVDLLFTTNGERILAGERPLAVEPLRPRSRSWFGRILSGGIPKTSGQ